MAAANPIEGVILVKDLISKMGITFILLLSTILSSCCNSTALSVKLIDGIKTGDEQAVLQAIREGANINTSFENLSPLSVACMYDHTDIGLLLIAKGANVNPKNTTGTPLHFASLAGNIDLVEALVDNGAAVNSRQFEHGITPLHMAASTNQLEVIEFLLLHGADTSLKDDAGNTAYDSAKLRDKSEAANALSNSS